MIGGAGLDSRLARESRAIAAVIVALLIGMIFTVLIALPGPAAAATTPYRVLRIGSTGLEVHNLNPNAMTLVMEYTVNFNVYSTLITYDANYHVKGDLAYSWGVASDNVTWTLNLVHNAYFTNPDNPADRSHPATADDVVFTYQIQQNTTASIFNSYTTEIANIWKVDNYTVKLQTKAPFAAIYSTLSAVPILPQYLWSTVSNIVTRMPSAAPYPLGSGAMFYDHTNSSISSGPIILKRNPNYYGPQYYCQSSRPNEVRVLFYSTPTSMTSDFLSGSSKLDAIIDVDGLDYQRNIPASGTNGFYKWAVDGGFVAEIAVNVMTPQIRSLLTQFKTGYNNPLLLNDTVRLAIAMSINKSALITYGLQGIGSVADTLVPGANPWHYAIPASDQYKFDPAAARARLNSQGWSFDSSGASNPSATPLYQSGGKNGLVFRLYTPDNHPEFAPMVANMTSWLGQAGIQTTDDKGSYTPGYAIKSLPFMDSAWKAGDYDIWLWDWVFSPVSDPSLDVLQVETTAALGTLSDNYWSNSTYDNLYNQSLVAVDPTARRQITNTMQKMIYDYHSYILPYYGSTLYAATNRTDLASGWEGWGDWSQSKALPPDSDLPNLWFQVYPHDQQPPVVQSFSPVQGYTTLPSSFNVVASDTENDIVNYTWDFGDGTTAVTAGGSTAHVYAATGPYQVTVRVTDGEWTSCASTTATIAQYTGGAVNLPPSIKSFIASPTSATTNQTVTFQLTANDSDGDSLSITWNFGDGASATNYLHNTTVNTRTDQVVTQTHAYPNPGTYNVTVTVKDNQTSPGLNHVLTQTQQVTVTKPSGGGGGGGVGSASNPWISYGIPLAVVAMIVVAVAAVLLRRRKTMKEEEQREEPKQGPPPAPPPP